MRRVGSLVERFSQSARSRLNRQRGLRPWPSACEIPVS